MASTLGKLEGPRNLGKLFQELIFQPLEPVGSVLLQNLSGSLRERKMIGRKEIIKEGTRKSDKLLAIEGEK